MLGPTASSDAGQALRYSLFFFAPTQAWDQRSGCCRSRESESTAHVPRRYPRIMASRRTHNIQHYLHHTSQKVPSLCGPPRQAHADAVEHEGQKGALHSIVRMGIKAKPERDNLPSVLVIFSSCQSIAQLAPVLACKVNTRRNVSFLPFI
jgi:hypothetical protein